MTDLSRTIMPKITPRTQADKITSLAVDKLIAIAVIDLKQREHRFLEISAAKQMAKNLADNYAAETKAHNSRFYSDKTIDKHLAHTAATDYATQNRSDPFAYQRAMSHFKHHIAEIRNYSTIKDGKPDYGQGKCL